MSEQELRITTNHKDLVPEGWFYSDLNNYINIGRGFAFKSDDYRDQGVPVVRVTNIENSGQINLSNNVVFIEKDEAESYLNYKLEVGDVLIVMVGATVGKLAKVESRCADALLNQNMWRLTVKSRKKFSQEYLYHAIKPVVDEFLSTLQGSARGFLTQKDFSIAEVLLPPLPEQQKIATILTSVDTVIEKTRAQIDKLKHLKTGMMQQLLTQGIGHTEFKNTPVGRIPKSWDVGTLDSFGVGIFDGDRGKEYPKENDFYPSEFCLFLSAKNVTKNGFLFNEMAFITQEKDKLLRKGKLTRGDIVITTRGTIGNIAFYSPDVAFENIRINSGMAIIRNSDTSLNSEFLHLLMNSPIITEQTELLAFGSAQPQLTISIIKNLIVPKPNLDEQKAITSAVSAVNKKLQLTNKKLDLLTSTKKALMQDLLTGKVRARSSS